MTFKKKLAWIKKAKENNACREFFIWLENKNIEKLEISDLDPMDGLWAVGKIDLPVSPGQIDKWGDKYPGVALRHCSNRLTHEQIEKWGDRRPIEALKYCSDKLTPEQIDRWGDRQPWTALKYYADILTSDQIEKWGDRYPGAALEYCLDRLTPEQYFRWRK